MTRANEVRLNAPQTRFLDAIQDNRFILFGAGVGTGKTSLARWMAIYLAQANPGLPGLIVSHNMDHCKGEIADKLVATIEAQEMLRSRNINEKKIVLSNGAEIRYGSADKAKSIDGKDVAWCIGDEIRYWQQETYKNFIARARVKAAPLNRILCFSTLETNWMEDEWRDKPHRKVIHATTYENAHNLTETYIADLEQSLTRNQFKQYVLAQWVSASASIFGDSYSKDISIQDGLYVRGYPVILGMDFGIQSPATVFAQHFDWCERHRVKGCIHIIDELVPDNCPLDSLVPKIRKKERECGYDIREVYVDPAGQQRDQVYGFTCIGLLHEENFDVYYTTEPKNVSVKNGLNVISSRFLNPRGEVRMYIDESLTRLKRDGNKRCLLYALENYRWTPTLPGKPVRDKPVHDATSHIIDALRYLVIGLYPPMDIL